MGISTSAQSFENLLVQLQEWNNFSMAIEGVNIASAFLLPFSSRHAVTSFCSRPYAYSDGGGWKEGKRQTNKAISLEKWCWKGFLWNNFLNFALTLVLFSYQFVCDVWQEWWRAKSLSYFYLAFFSLYNWKNEKNIALGFSWLPETSRTSPFYVFYMCDSSFIIAIKVLSFFLFHHRIL